MEAYFQTPSFLRCVFFNESVVVLDLKKDAYLVLPPPLSNALHIALSYPFKKTSSGYSPQKKVDDFPKDFDSLVKELQKGEFLKHDLCEAPNFFSLPKSPPSSGAANLDWRLETADLEQKTSLRLIFEAYMTLIRVYCCSYFSQFTDMIQLLHRCQPKKPRQVSRQEFAPLVRALNQACFYFPVRVKCLEWSVSLCLMAFRRSFDCHLEIGVQNMPFLAHAWVRIKEGVIADNQDLPTSLSVILKEPLGKAS